MPKLGGRFGTLSQEGIGTAGVFAPCYFGVSGVLHSNCFGCTHKHDCCKHDGWDACDVNGDVDLSYVSMLESLFGKTIADVLKSESHLSLLKLDPTTTSTEELHASAGMAS